MCVCEYFTYVYNFIEIFWYHVRRNNSAKKGDNVCDNRTRCQRMLYFSFYTDVTVKFMVWTQFDQTIY